MDRGRGSVKLSVAVMAHPRRAHYFSHLEEHLPGASWFIDENSDGPWPNAQRAWRSYDPGAAFHVVIQDDALVCRDFRARAEAVLTKPTRAYSFYYGQNSARAHTAARLARSARTGTSRRLYWGVAIALPVHLIDPMLEWTETRRVKMDREWGNRRADSRVGRYLLKFGILVDYPLPCLIDHRNGSSLIQNYRIPASQRVAVAFADRPQAPISQVAERRERLRHPTKRDRVAKVRKSAKGRSKP